MMKEMENAVLEDREIIVRPQQVVLNTNNNSNQHIKTKHKLVKPIIKGASIVCGDFASAIVATKGTVSSEIIN